MGQAKRRGTQQERIEQSISSCKEIMDKLLLKPSVQEEILKQSPARQKYIIYYALNKAMRKKNSLVSLVTFQETNTPANTTTAVNKIMAMEMPSTPT